MLAVILSTYPTRAGARKAAGLAIEKRLAGCVLTIPVGSVYRWNPAINPSGYYGARGKVQNKKEVLAVFKTTKERAKQLMKFIGGHHPYKVPFVAAVPLGQVSRRYQEWIKKEVR